MGIRRFKTSLFSQQKQYGILSGKTVVIQNGIGGTLTKTGGYNIHTFSYTGSDQNFNITSAINIEIFMWGAAGGGSNAEGYSDPGGPGGYATSVIKVDSGNYIIQVGQGGMQSTNSARPASRPYPEGGHPSVRNGYINGSGGGRSAIFKNSVNASNAIIIAGGGGGGAGNGGSGADLYGKHGGGGGGTTGISGSSYGGGFANNGGTQNSGGYTQSGSSRASAQLAGADAGNGTAWSTGWNAAGGGGDGWYGGGAQEAHVGGGGGSGYLSPNIISGFLEGIAYTNTRYTSAVNPPQTNNQYYQTGIGRGNINAVGGNGLVVIRYLISDIQYD